MHGLFEWKKSAGHALCKKVSEYYDFFLLRYNNNDDDE